MSNQHSYYLDRAFASKKTLKETISAVCTQIRKRVKSDEIPKFDFIAVRGVSGIAIGLPVALRLNKDIAICRKQDEKSHASTNIEGLPTANNKHFRYLIIDDFIATGHTIRTIIKDIKNAEIISPEHNIYLSFECVGIVQYNSLRKFSLCEFFTTIQDFLAIYP